MSLFNIQKVQKQLTWLTEQIRCLKLEIGTGGLYSIGAIEIPLPQLEVLTQDPLIKASLEINAMPKLTLTGDFVVFFKTYIGEDLYVITFNNKKFLGDIGQGGDTTVSKEDLMLVSSIQDIDIEEIIDSLRYTNENTPPLTIGGFTQGQPATPEEGLTLQEAFDKLLFPAVEPTVSISVSGQPEFKEPNFTNTLNWSIVVNSTGATINSLSLEFRRNNSGSWVQLEDDITATSFGHVITGNTSNDVWNYRLVVTDTQGATTIATVNRTMKAYQAPTINFSLSSSNLNHFERGESISVTGGTVSRNSPFVPITNYVLEQQLNGGAWTQVATNPLNANGGNILNYTFSNGQNNSTIRFRVIVTDSEGTTTQNSSIITFRQASFFGWSTITSWQTSLLNNLSKYLLTSRSNTFNNINPGQGEFTYYIYPTSYGDLTSAIQDGAAPVLGSFSKIENSVSITNSYGVSINYMVYRSNADDAFSGNSVNFS